MGLKIKKKKPMKKQILPITKHGRIIPILPLLRVVNSLVGGATRVAKVTNDNKAASVE